MLGRLLLLFTLVPAVELYLLITLGSALGPAATVALVLGTGMLGAWLARREGGRVLREWQGAVARGELPQEGVTSSLLVLVGGVLLVTPGVLTDITGLLLLIPPTRRAIAQLVSARVAKQLESSTVIHTFPMDASVGATTPGAGAVIDVDAHEKRSSGKR